MLATDHAHRFDLLARREEDRVSRGTGVTITTLGNRVMVAVAKSAPLCPTAREFVAGWRKGATADLADTDDASPGPSILILGRSHFQLIAGTHLMTAKVARRLAHRAARQQRRFLEQQRHVALMRRHATHRLAVQLDAAVRRRFESGDKAQQRRLAAPGRPDQHQPFARLNDEIDRRERSYTRRVGHAKRIKPDRGHARQ